MKGFTFQLQRKKENRQKMLTKILKNYKGQNIHKKMTKHSHNGYRSFDSLFFIKKGICGTKL
jgi:hypothetical protein